jgi:hypothetical protein
MSSAIKGHRRRKRRPVTLFSPPPAAGQQDSSARGDRCQHPVCGVGVARGPRPVAPRFVHRNARLEKHCASPESAHTCALEVRHLWRKTRDIMSGGGHLAVTREERHNSPKTGLSLRNRRRIP